MVCKIKVTICQKSAVTRMVILGVELHQVVILKIRNMLGITSRIEFVLTCLKQVFIYVVYKGFFRVAHGSFHLIVDDAFKLERRLRVIPLFELKPVAFLHEVIHIHCGIKCHIAVH